jgi:DNA adenine methylase
MKSKRIKACSRVLFKTKEDVSPLTPIFKWTGGKRKEIDKFKSFFPSFVSDGTKYTYVEPFVGGGAVYFHLNNIFGKNVINDFDPLVSNLLSKEYYRLRNQDKDGGLKKLTNVEKAIRFFIVNQLAFSGMRRFNSSGEFNVPFGHYKGVNTNIVNSPEHIALLLKSEIHVGDFEPIMNNYDQDNTFMFLDPPYTREFKEYSAGNSFDEADQERLCKTIKNIKNASVMMIIDKSPLTERLYKDMIKHTYQLKYGVNIKNRFSTAVEHLIICNY